MKNLIEIIEQNSLVVRCLPREVVSLWSYKEGHVIKDNQKIVTCPQYNNRKFIRETRVVKNGGWWYVKEVRNIDSMVRFSRQYDKFFAPTLEKAIQLYLDSKKHVL